MRSGCALLRSCRAESIAVTLRPVSRADAQNAIETELVGERASSLRRSFEALEKALAELDRAIGPRDGLLAEAQERLWYLVIQREAVGLRRHEVLYDVLRIPREVRERMGPKPRGSVSMSSRWLKLK